jgi:hypothetical protein
MLQWVGNDAVRVGGIQSVSTVQVSRSWFWIRLHWITGQAFCGQITRFGLGALLDEIPLRIASSSA